MANKWQGGFLRDEATGALAVSGGAGGGSLPAGGTTGQVLTKNSATDGDASWQAPAASTDRVVSNPQTGPYTLVLADAGKSIDVTSAVPAAVTVPTNATVAFPAGTIVGVSQQGAGTVSVAAAAGVTIHPPTGYGLAVANQYGELSLRYLGSDVWNLTGNLAPA